MHRSWERWWIVAGIIFLYLILTHLFSWSVLRGNELSKYPWSFQAVDPTWLPRDWTMNLPLRSQYLVGLLMGMLVKYLGFLKASIAGRLIVYGLYAASLAGLTRKLKIPIFHVLIVLFLFHVRSQGLGAHEWLFGPAEPKVFAYPFVFWGIYYLLDNRYVQAAAFFGAASSLHILIGGYATLFCLPFLLYDRVPIRTLLRCIAIYSIFGIVAIYVALSDLAADVNMPEVSWLIVYYRTPHHMLPSEFFPWPPWRLIFFCVSWIIICRYGRLDEKRKKFLAFTALTMIPYFAGLAIAPFDHQGVFLKFYLFRLGDVLFPLFNLLAGYFLLESWIGARQRQILLGSGAAVAAIAAVGVFFVQVKNFEGKPSSEHEWVDVCTWIQNNTSRESLVVAPPGKSSFTILAQRAMVGQFFFFPFNMDSILEWKRRMLNLSGGRKPAKRGYAAAKELNENYYALSSDQILSLMDKYKAEYAITKCGEHSRLSLAYSNKTYCVYQTSRSAESK